MVGADRLIEHLGADDDSDKRDPKDVNYRESDRADNTCGNCKSFLGSEAGACKKVAGPVAAGGLCDLWTNDPKMEGTDSDDDER
jgi:hypothetical protein